MDQTIHVPDPIQDQLRLVFLDRADLIAALQSIDLEPIGEPPTGYRCRPTLAVPRPLDPETAEMKELEVLLEPAADGLRVISISGLDLEVLE